MVAKAARLIGWLALLAVLVFVLWGLVLVGFETRGYHPRSSPTAALVLVGLGGLGALFVLGKIVEVFRPHQPRKRP